MVCDWERKSYNIERTASNDVNCNTECKIISYHFHHFSSFIFHHFHSNQTDTKSQKIKPTNHSPALINSFHANDNIVMKSKSSNIRQKKAEKYSKRKRNDNGKLKNIQMAENVTKTNKS